MEESSEIDFGKLPWECIDPAAGALGCALAFNASGRFLATGTASGTVNIYDFRTIPTLARSYELPQYGRGAASGQKAGTKRKRGEGLVRAAAVGRQGHKIGRTRQNRPRCTRTSSRGRPLEPGTGRCRFRPAPTEQHRRA